MKLRIVFELVYYDRPFCLLLESNDKFYIGHFIKHVGNLERWFVHHISREDLLLLCKCKKDLLSVADAKEKYLYDYNRNTDSIESKTFDGRYGKWTLDMNQLKEYLPSSGFFFFEDELLEVEKLLGVENENKKV